MAKEGNGIVDAIYPTRVGGHTFFSGDTDLGSNGQFDPDGTLVSEGSGVYHLTDYTQVRSTAFPKSNYPTEDIGGDNMNFADSVRRGYAMTPDDWLNIEMTQYIKFSSASPADAEIIMKGSTGRHHTISGACCQGASYGVRLGQEPQANTEFFKEEWHVSYDSRGFKDIPTSVYSGSVKDGNWHGHKFMNYEIIVNGKKCRKLEHWFDADGDGTGFVKVNETIDQGGWNQHGDTCHGAKDQIITWANGRVNWRFDLPSTNMKFRWLSCREIDVNGNPDQGTGGGSDGGGGSGTGGGGDAIGQDGVTKIYPDKQGGFLWYMDPSNPFGDGHLEKGGGSTYSKLVKNGDGSWKPNADGTIKFNFLWTPGQKEAIGSCKMDFSACMQRGYTGHQGDPKNYELTAFYKMTSPVDHQGIYMRGPFNHHPSGSGLCCEEAEYDIEVKADGSFKFTKELQGEVTHPQGVQQISGVSDLTTLGWFGLKYIMVVESDDPASPKVRLEAYINKNGDKKTWIKIGTAVDDTTTHWGIGQAVCNGDPYQVYAWAGRGLVIKWYNGHIDFKDWSVREIDPSGTFEPPPVIQCPAGQILVGGVCVPDTTGGGGGGGTGPPTTTRVQFFLRILTDVNTVTGLGACSGTGGGGGGPSGTLNKFYSFPADNDKSLADNGTQNHRTRIGQIILASTSFIAGKIIKQLDVPMKRTSGAPAATPLVYAKIWSSSGSVIYTSPTTFDPSAFTTSFVTKSFDFSTNTHPMAIGDIIGVEYKGTSSTNYVICGYADSPTNNRSTETQYEGTTWDTHTDRDFGCDLWN